MKVAVIGIGCIAQVHIPSLLHCGQEIVALCDCEREKCEKAVQKYGLEKSRIYTDYIRMLDEVKPESVHVCTKNISLTRYIFVRRIICMRKWFALA